MNRLMIFMSRIYLSMKAVHLIAAFAWMAGMLYLPRLFAYHAQAGVGTPQAEVFKAMERRLLMVRDESGDGRDCRLRNLDASLSKRIT